MTVRQLLARAAECEACGKEHKPRVRQPGFAPNWASPADGHPYRARLPRQVIAQIRTLADNS